MFACAHPALEAGIRAPLILQTILGFDAATIASAFLISPTTMGQRLVRAKSRIRQTGIPFGVPARADLRERLDAVLEAVYAAYAEGWVDPTGADARRRNLADEAIWLGRLLASLLPQEPEAPAHRWGLRLATALAYALLLGWTLGLTTALGHAALAPERLQAVLDLWGWMLAYPVVYFLTAWVFFYGLQRVEKTA